MNDHEVRVDDTVVPVKLTFSETFNVARHFTRRHIERGLGDKALARWRDHELSFAETAENTDHMTNALRALGVRPGERVMLFVKDVAAFYYGFLGAIQMGAIPIPVNYFLRSTDYAYMLAHSAARVVVASSEAFPEVIPALDAEGVNAEFLIAADGERDSWLSLDKLLGAADPIAEAEPTGPESDCFWLYSSGSTGDPKASVHQHKDMIYTSQYYGVGIGGITADSVLLSPPKMFFAYGLGNSVSFPLWTGATAVLLEERPTAENTLELLNATRPTHYFGVPTLYAAQLQAMDQGMTVDTSSVELCISGGEPLPPAIYDNWKKKTGLEIIDSLGSSEVLHFYTSNRPGKVKLGSAGPIVAGYEGRIVDEDGNDLPDGEVGELAIKGESTARYYWNKPEQTARAMREGWFLTGDTCARDSDGYYFFHGRHGDMLKVGGIWVSPFEVESAVVEHPSVLETAVTGWPDENGLIKPKAVVVVRDGIAAGPALEQEIMQFVRDRLAPFKYPRWVEFVDELPKTSSGKIQRFRLRA